MSPAMAMRVPTSPPQDGGLLSEEDGALLQGARSRRHRWVRAAVALCGAGSVVALLSWRDAPAPMAPEAEALQLAAAPPAGDGAHVDLCTDGWFIDASMHVRFAQKGTGLADLITSSGGAFTLVGDLQPTGPVKVTFSISTFDYGTVSVRTEMERGVTHLLRARKTRDSVCLAVNGTEPVCTLPPLGSMPITSFQMRPVGMVAYGNSGLAAVTDFQQQGGLIPVSFKLSKAPLDQIWNGTGHLKQLALVAKEALAYVAGEGIAPPDVHAFVAASSGDGVVVQGTVVPPRSELGLACKVQKTLAASMANGYFGAVVRNRLAAANISSVKPGADVVEASAPAAVIPTEAVRCRHSERRDLVFGSKCSGFGCLTASCEEIWPGQQKPLPYSAANVSGPISGGTPVAATYTQPVVWRGFPMPPTPVFTWNLTTAAVVPNWQKALTTDGEPNGVKLGAFHTDGFDVDFEVSVQLLPGALVSPQTILVSEPGSGLSLMVSKSTSLLKGTIRFESTLLTGVGNGGCSVDSVPILLGKKVRVRVTRSQEKCCITVSPDPCPGPDSSKLTCQSRTVSADEFQMRPGDRLVVPQALKNVVVNSYAELKGSMTMSLAAAYVSYDDVIGKCNCLDKVLRAIRKTVAFGAELGTKEEQVSVVLKRAAVFDKPLPQLSAAQIAQLHQEFADRVVMRRPELTPKQELLQRIRQATIEKIENNTAFADLSPVEIATQESKALAEAKEALRAGRRLAAAAPKFVRAGGLNYVAAVKAAAQKVDPTFSAAGHDALDVYVTIAGCDASCEASRAALVDPGFVTLLQRELESVVGTGASTAGDAKASTGTVAVVGATCPAHPTTCAHVTCDNHYHTNADPMRPCFGAGCLIQCCKPRTCSQVQCQKPLIRVIGTALSHTCSSEEECLDTCCVRSCTNVECVGDSVCPKKGAWMITSKPSRVQETCCEKQEPTCCNACTAWCAACHKCQSRQSYCESLVMRWAPGALFGGVRRLRGVDEEEGEAPEPMPERPGYTAEELEEDVREARRGVEEARRLSAGEDVARAAGLEGPRAKMLEDAIQRAKDTAAFRLENAHKATVAKRDPVQRIRSAVPAAKWNAAVKAAAAKKKGLIMGCEEPIVPAVCSYNLVTTFTMGHCKGPTAVHTVKVLSDTDNAVSCGDDGICWVWKIRTGVPISVFVPDELGDKEPRPPVRTVSVLNDATYILSAGQKTHDPEDGGKAYIWDWRKGFQKTSFECKKGTFLSSAEMPAWRMTLLGCSDGFTTVWEWGSGAKVVLPYHARTKKEQLDEVAGRMEDYFENNIEGLKRLKIARAVDGIRPWIAWLNKTHPEISEIAEWKAGVYDKRHENRMGPVTSIAYTPTDLRFVTGSADGRVRLWDAASGTLLRIMHGHQGKVNAVAAFPNLLHAASGGDDGVIRVWDLETGLQLRHMYQAYGGPVLSLAVMPGGKEIVAGSEDGHIRIWSVDTGIMLCGINTGGKAVNAVAVNPSNPIYQIISANADGIVRVYNP